MSSTYPSPSNNHYPEETENGDDDHSVSSKRSSTIFTPEEAAKHQELAAKETRVLRYIRLALCVILLLAASVVAASVYIYTSNDEEDAFREEFLEYAKAIEDTVQTNAQNRLEAIGALAAQIQAHAHTTNSTWPFVTVPFFEDQVNVMKSLTDAYVIALYQVVTNKDRLAWEAYSLQNQHWVNDSYAAQVQLHGQSGEVPPGPDETWFDILWGEGYQEVDDLTFESGIGDKIFAIWDPADDENLGPFPYPEKEMYFPQWQAAPLDWYYQSTVNADYSIFSDFLDSTSISISSGDAVMGEAWTDDIVPGYITTMIYPIYDKFYGDDKNVVAFLGADIYWQDYIKNILPASAEGVVVVIENTLGDVFTYELVGPVVSFLGDGDLHDSSFGGMEESFLFGEHLQASQLSTNSSYDGAPLHDGFIQYTFRMYPSEKLEGKFVTNKPIIYTLFACIIFGVTCAIFFLYDCFVEKRQRLVVSTAEKSDAIVSSLFPNNVKERLYKGEERRVKFQKDRAEFVNTPESAAMNSLALTLDNHQEELSGSFEGPPIAELYEAATVFFAGKYSKKLGNGWKAFYYTEIFVLYSHFLFCQILLVLLPGVPDVHLQMCLHYSKCAMVPLTKLPIIAVFSKLRLLEIVTLLSRVFRDLDKTMQWLWQSLQETQWMQ